MKRASPAADSGANLAEACAAIARALTAEFRQVLREELAPLTKPPPPEEMSAARAISEKRVRAAYLHDAIRSGELPATRRGARWIIRRVDLDAWQPRRSER